MSEKRKRVIERQQGSSHYGDRESCLRGDILPIYQIKKGDNYICFLPPEKEDEYFGLRIFVHYQIGVNRGSVLCNAGMWGTPCSICEERHGLYDRGGGEKEVKALNSTPRYLYIILDVANREEIRKGPQIFFAPITIEDNVRKQCRDPKTGEILDISDPDPKEGRVFYFERKGSTMTDTDYLGFRLYPMDYEIPKSLLKGLPKLLDLLVKRTYEEVRDIFRGGIGTVKREEEEEKVREMDDEIKDLRENRFKERETGVFVEGNEEKEKSEGEGIEKREGEERIGRLRQRLSERGKR